MTFSRDQQDVTGGESCDGSSDRLGTIADFRCAFCAGKDSSPDRTRIFSTWIVIRHDNQVAFSAIHGP